MSQFRQYYVYELFDPRTDLQFYVGKGQDDRAFNHQKDVELGRAGCNARKVAKIREILALGMDVGVRFVAFYDNETDALNHEL